MKMTLPKGKAILVVIVALAVVLSIIWLFRGSNSAQAPTEDVVYYYGKDCPHCQNVAKFIEENRIAEKVTFAKKEISNPIFSAELLDKAGQCGLNKKEVGVPLVFSEGKCYTGDTDVITFFKKKAGM